MRWRSPNRGNPKVARAPNPPPPKPPKIKSPPTINLNLNFKDLGGDLYIWGGAYYLRSLPRVYPTQYPAGASSALGPEIHSILILTLTPTIVPTLLYEVFETNSFVGRYASIHPASFFCKGRPWLRQWSPGDGPSPGPEGVRFHISMHCDKSKPKDSKFNPEGDAKVVFFLLLKT